MSNIYKVLESDSNFMTAAMSQRQYPSGTNTMIIQKGESNDYGGIVEGDHSGMVKIAGNCFRRDRFEFRAYIK